MGSLTKTLFVIVLLSCCTSLIQATNLETKSVGEVRLRRQSSTYEAFIANCPPGEVLTEILLASPSDNCRIAFLAIAGIDTSDFLTRAEEVLGYLRSICQDDCRNFVYSTLLRCLPTFIPLLQLSCASNHNQLQCWQTVALNNGTAVLANCYPELYPAEVGSGSGAIMSRATPETLDENGTRYCTPQCQNALMVLRDQHGCCASNAFNTTTFGLLRLGIANYSLWSSCEIETTTFCPEPSFVNIFEEAVTTDDSYAQRTTVSFFVLTLLVAIGSLF